MVLPRPTPPHTYRPRTGAAGGGWAWAGVRYAGYNLAVIAPVLATLRWHESRRETFIAGALTGPVAMIPALLFHLAAVVDAAHIPVVLWLQRDLVLAPFHVAPSERGIGLGQLARVAAAVGGTGCRRAAGSQQ